MHLLPESSWLSITHHKEDFPQCTSRIDGSTCIKAFQLPLPSADWGLLQPGKSQGQTCQIPSAARTDYLQQLTLKTMILPWFYLLVQLKNLSHSSLVILCPFYYSLQKQSPHYKYQAVKSKGQIHPDIQAHTSHSVSNKIQFLQDKGTEMQQYNHPSLWAIPPSSCASVSSVFCRCPYGSRLHTKPLSRPLKDQRF